MMSVRPTRFVTREGCVLLTCVAVAAARARREKSFMLEPEREVLCVHVVVVDGCVVT